MKKIFEYLKIIVIWGFLLLLLLGIISLIKSSGSVKSGITNAFDLLFDNSGSSSEELERYLIQLKWSSVQEIILNDVLTPTTVKFPPFRDVEIGTIEDEDGNEWYYYDFKLSLNNEYGQRVSQNCSIAIFVEDGKIISYEYLE